MKMAIAVKTEGGEVEGRGGGGEGHKAQIQSGVAGGRRRRP